MYLEELVQFEIPDNLCFHSSPWANGGPRAPPPHTPTPVSGTILFRGPPGIILAMLPEKNWDSLLISAIFQNGRLKILDF